MKKVVSGLAGIVLSFAGVVGLGGCMVYEADKEVNQIIAHHNAIKKIISASPQDINEARVHYEAIKKIVGAVPEDYIYLSEPTKKGEPFIVDIRGENYIKIRQYLDTNSDGKYEEKVESKVKFPDKFDIKVLPPTKPYQPEKQENLQKKEKIKIWAYDI